MFMRFYCRLCVGDMYEKTETLFLGSGWSPCHIVMKTFMKVVSSNPGHSHFDVNQSWGEQCVDVGLTRSKWDSKDQAYWHCIDNHTFWCLKIKNKLEPCSFVYILLISKPEVGLNLDLGLVISFGVVRLHVGTRMRIKSEFNLQTPKCLCPIVLRKDLFRRDCVRYS